MNNLKDKIDRFNKRWNILNDENKEESFEKFKTRIINIFERIDGQLRRKSISDFCQIYGIREEWRRTGIGTENSYNVITKLNHIQDELELYKFIEIIFSLEYNVHSQDELKNSYYKKVLEAIEFSNLNVSISNTDGEIILYPKGEEKLDQELVDNVFSFLSGSSNQHFLEALQFYQDKKYEKTAESLRRSLEEYLRTILSNKKGLDPNIKELGKQIKKDTSPKIRNIIMQIFGYLDDYFNENSKHNDGVDEEDAEFLIYQVALLMRYIKLVLSK